MFEELELTRMANALASHAGARMGLIAQNIANADTPGYKAMELPDFAEVWQGGEGMKATRPGHLTDAATGTPLARQSAGDPSPDGNTVSLEGQMVAATDARQSHDMALAVYSNTSDILRASLGRSR